MQHVRTFNSGPAKPACPPPERRRERRICCKLRGRFLLPDGGEHPCESLDVSASGLAVSSPMVPRCGERVVVHLAELGRLEGVVVRGGTTRFALQLLTPASRKERLAQKVAALGGDAAGG